MRVLCHRDLIRDQRSETELFLNTILGTGLLWLERGFIGDKEADSFETALRKIDSSGMGGDFYACQKISQAIEYAGNHVTVVAFGSLASGAFLITQILKGMRLASNRWGKVWLSQYSRRYEF